MLGSACERIVGSKKRRENPATSRRLPPTRNRAPRAIASATCASTFASAASLMSGPMRVDSSVGSPIAVASARTRASSRARNSSAIEAANKKRFAQMHVWPMKRNFESIACSTARSRSASAKTMNGAFPPSSSAVLMSRGAHCAARIRPTSVEPVKLSLRVEGCEISAPATVGGSPITTLNAAIGAPFSRATFS